MKLSDNASKTQALINKSVKLAMELEKRNPERAVELYAELAKAQAMMVIAETISETMAENSEQLKNISISLDTNFSPLKIDKDIDQDLKL